MKAASREPEMNSILSWIGGKRLLARRIVDVLPEHVCYCEPFSGAAWVFFAKPKSKVEVLNDKDGDLVNLLLCVREHPDELLRQCEHLVASRRIFELFLAQPGLTDIQRAARMLYVAKTTFGADLSKPTHGYSATQPPRWNRESIQRKIAEVSDRLDRVELENLDFADVLSRYDRPTTLFYLDPPYYETRGYRVPFELVDHVRLVESLRNLSGSWLLSYNDHPRIREFYEGFGISEVGTLYTCSGRTRPANELLISNFPLDLEGSLDRPPNSH